MQLAKAAGLKHEEYGYSDKSLVPIDKARYDFSDRGWRWVLAHDGTPNLNRKPASCLAECASGNRFAGVDRVGLAIHLIHGPRKHVMDLPASVRAVDRGHYAYVGTFGDPRLGAVGCADVANPGCGTVVFVWE